MTKKKLIISSIFIICLGVAMWLFLINDTTSLIGPCSTIRSSQKDLKKCEVKSTYQIDGASVSYVITTNKAISLCGGGDCQSYEGTNDLLVESNGNIISIMGPADQSLLSRIERAFPFCGENLIVENNSITGKLKIDLIKNNEKYFWKYNFSNYSFSDCELNGLALLGINDKKSDFKELKATFMSSETMDCDNKNILDKMCARMMMNSGLLRKTCNGSSQTDMKEACLVAKAMYENNPKICQDINQSYSDSVSCYANVAIRSEDENICKQVKNKNLFAPSDIPGWFCLDLYRNSVNK
jgi:hypothetical protein